MPIPICMAIILCGLYLYKRNRMAMARKLLIASALLVTFFSLPITSQLLIRPLELAYPKLPIEDPNYLATVKPAYVVVMGCWHSDNQLLPLVAQIHQCSLPRIIQAVQMWHQYPTLKIIFSGYAAMDDKKSDPAINAELAVGLGVPLSNIVLIEGPKDSLDEVLAHKKVVETSNFIVVSSATHIKRLDYLYRSNNLSPIFSPAEYVSGYGELSWRSFVPNASSIYQSERAIYEYLGLLWVTIKSVV
ncbi:ElyC/SanA/YdcF family protein [Psychrosphaera sp. 1_MG-2023]|uniref:ElyC/SanA/YdcF family protein n=1 Tax=Psychrosphaera sp. 1_MG-2023 TaxID=3062643 RepID=UPI0026E1BDA9|nr:ElyC/SanA/YdcF family protein [Psychrosphaera sp. 1_MG-2023]MDO6720390.1 ElyC/SanA/YdcF family protein [Psychrosphaera sp. 1_MG-2023]